MAMTPRIASPLTQSMSALCEDSRAPTAALCQGDFRGVKRILTSQPMKCHARAMRVCHATVVAIVLVLLQSCSLARAGHDIPPERRISMVIVGDSIPAGFSAGRADATLVYRLA